MGDYLFGVDVVMNCWVVCVDYGTEVSDCFCYMNKAE